MNIQREKQDVRDSIAQYYKGIVMTKGKSNSEYDIWYARIGCLLCVEDQYLVVISPAVNSLPINTMMPLEKINWDSFQTRTITKSPIRLRSQDINGREEDIVLKDEIYFIDQTEDRFIYGSKNFPLKIELLKDKNGTVYNEKGTIKTALETYQCVITFNV